jgi:hypothetical protein
MRIGERVIICKVYFVIVMLECMGPAESKIPFQKLCTFAISIFVVFDIFAGSMPADIVVL